MSPRDTLHRALQRQIARSGLSLDELTEPRHANLLARVSSAYDDADRQRYLHDRAFLLASSEMQDLYEQLKESSQSAAAIQRDRLKAVFDTAATGLIVLEGDENVFDLNPVAESVLDLDHDAMLGAPFDEVLIPTDPADPAMAGLREAISGGNNWRSSDTMLTTRLGRTVSVSLLFRALQAGGGVLAIEDITERKQAQADLLWRANHDPLTSLLNRAALIDRIGRALQRARRYESGLAVLFIDLDRFKRVNDSLGHAVGDALLVECARRITSSVREVDTVARLGGDEFVAVCENLTDESAARAVAQRVSRWIGRPYSLEGDVAYVEASIGIALSDGHDNDPDGLLRDADVALYEAKQQAGPAVVVYTDAMIHRMQHALELERRLRRALGSDELWVAYQPIYALDTRAVTGYEALARWTSPAGPVVPDEFIPTAETAGLLNDLGRFLMRQAFAFQAALPPGIDISINMCPSQIGADGIVEWLQEAVAEAAADPARIIIEITERAAIPDYHIGQRLTRLQEHGFRIALDDFGVGHSSLSHLRTLPLDIIKVDRSFLASTAQDGRAATLARMVCEIGRALGIQVIAEGIETEDQMQFLAEIGCTLGQGFLLGVPQPAHEALAYLDQPGADGLANSSRIKGSSDLSRESG